MDAITTSALTKRYDGTIAVDSLDLTIPSSSVFAFLGPNGAGKTTTIRMLTTLTKPTSGTATVAGYSIENRASVTEKIGLLPADPPVYAELTGREHLHYVARLHELGASTATDRINAYLDRFDLTGAANDRVSTYSTGMRKKLGLIAAIIHDPHVVFLDEPTSGLDPRAARTVREMILDLTDQERTIFLSTHILPVADELADEVGVIHEGQLVAQGSPDELKDQFRSTEETGLEAVFLGLTREPAQSEDPSEFEERAWG